MRTGELRERIDIQSLTRVEDNQGGFSESFSLLATVWAKVHAESASERMRAGQQDQLRTFVITIRYRGDVDPRCRIVLGAVARTLKIVSTRDMTDERMRWLEIRAEEEDAT